MSNRTLLSVIAFLAFQTSIQAATPSKIESPVLSDEQIVDVAVTLSDGEINDGKVAKIHARAGDVKNFAKMKVEHHIDSKREAERIAKEQKMKAEKSNLSKFLREDAKTTNLDLKRQKSDVVDRFYIDQQITAHEKTLATLDNILIPQVENPALKAHLEATRKSVSEHLEKARSIQSQMASK